MTTSPPPSAPTSIAARILFFVLGVAALTVGTLITLGAALAGAVAIGIAAYMVRRKGGRLTRRGAWLASVGGTIGLLAALIAVVMLTDESSRQPLTPAQRAESRTRAQDRMPEWMKAIDPNAQRRTVAADSMADRLLQNKAVVVWAGMMASVIAATMIGTIAGSFAWGGLMLIYRGYRGEWMPGASSDPSTIRP